MEYKPSKSVTAFLGLALLAAGVVTVAGPIDFLLASRMYDPSLYRYHHQVITTTQGLARTSTAYSRRAEESQRQVRDYKSRLEWANAHVCNSANIYVPTVGLLEGNQLWRRFEGDFENGSCYIIIDRDIICSDKTK